MPAKVLVPSHSTSHSPVGSPDSSIRTHRKLASSTSPVPFASPTTGRVSKRKSWQTSENIFFTHPWTESSKTDNWEINPLQPWTASGAVGAEMSQIATHHTLAPKQVPIISHEDHLRPNSFDDASHKYSPASSARNSVQSIPVTTPSLMGSMDSAHDGSGLMDDGRMETPQYPSSFPTIADSSYSHPSVHPQLTLQTQLPQSQSPPGVYGAHYSHTIRAPYPSARDYHLPYEQLSYTSPTHAGPPLAVFSPVLQHPPHPSNVAHGYYRRPQPPHSFYPDYMTSPTTAGPPTGYYFAAPHQSVTWNTPHPPSISQTQAQASTGFINVIRHQDMPPHQPFTGVIDGKQGVNKQSSVNNSFVSLKRMSHAPSQSVPLPARGRRSTGLRSPVVVNETHQAPHTVNRTNRKEQRDSVPIRRSAILDEFRNNRNKRWELQDIVGHVTEFSKDQHGSRFIQHKLTTAHESMRNIAYREIVPLNVLQLAQDVFGNYVLQKMCELGKPEERAAIAETLRGHILQLALDMYGCRVLQKMIEYLSAEEQAEWVIELHGHVLQCVKDANGNHVIQKFLEQSVSEHPAFVRIFRNHVFELATHPYGCRVLQRCFEHVEPEVVKPLLQEMHSKSLNLMQDQYGNYVMQYMLEKGAPQDRDQIIQRLVGNMLPMSKHKFASNVCEKAILNASTAQKEILVKEISLTRPDGMNPIITMIKDQYANYVLQRALQSSEGKLLDIVIIALRPQLLNMRRLASTSPFSKHISSIERILRERSIDINAREYTHLAANSEHSDSSGTPTAESKPPGISES